MMERIIFDNEESAIINSVCTGEPMNRLTRSYLLECLQTVKNFMLTGEGLKEEKPEHLKSMIEIDIIDGIILKFDVLSDAQWDDMKLLLPFPVVWTPEDEDFDLEEDGAE